MAFLTTNDGVELYYEQRGAGRALMFIGGWCMSTPWWHGQMDDLADEFRCIAYDPRAYGKSEKVTHGHRMSRHARDLYDVLTLLELEDTIVVGWSTGGATLLAYSELFRDERVGGMVIVDQSPCNINRPGWDWGFGTRAEADAFIVAIETDHRAAAEGLLDAMFMTPPTEVDRHWMLEEMLKTPAAAAAALERDDLVQDWRDVLGDFPVPALILAGGQSQIFPNEACRHLAEHIPNARLVVFEQSGHCPFLEEREAFNDEVRRFAAALGRAG